jgi:hypothetical protein
MRLFYPRVKKEGQKHDNWLTREYNWQLMLLLISYLLQYLNRII